MSRLKRLSLCVCLKQVENDNLFYILYYSLAFIVITHAWPFFAIACRNKDMIDACHHAQDVLPMQQQIQEHQTLADIEELLMNTRKRHGRL